MNKHKNLILSLVLFTLFSSCNFLNQPESPEPFPPDSGEPWETQPLFSSIPAVGQTSSFVYFEGENDGLFSYFQDTLILTIVSEDNGKFLVQEVISPGSTSRNGGTSNYIQNPELTFEFYLEKIADTLRISPKDNDLSQSNIFRILAFENYKNDGGLDFHTFDYDNPKRELLDWGRSLMDEFAKTPGYLENTLINGVEYERLNVETSQIASVFDGPGYIKIFSPDEGLVKMVETASMTAQGFGWDRIPK